MPNDRTVNPHALMNAVKPILLLYQRVASGSTQGAGGTYYANGRQTLNGLTVNIDLIEELARACGHPIYPRERDNQAQVLDYLKDALAYAPKDHGTIAKGLLGWQTPGGFCCAKCIGRILGRGLHIPDCSVAVWVNDDQPNKECCTCGRETGSLEKVEANPPPAQT